MRLTTRKILDGSLSASGVFSLVLMAGALLVIFVPLAWKGSQAFIFRETVERRAFMLQHQDFRRGNKDKIKAELNTVREARQPVYKYLRKYKEALGPADITERQTLRKYENHVRELLGPLPWDGEQQLPRKRYGDTRWDRAKVHLHDLLYKTTWVSAEQGEWNTKKEVLRSKSIGSDKPGVYLKKLLKYCEDRENVRAMLHPRWTFYWRFWLDKDIDSYFFGGIMPALLGTLYFGIGAMLVAGPVGVISAVFLTEYTQGGPVVGMLRSCISTLAGVPSIVFGLFGLAFFINTLHVSDSTSAIVGILTLALLILPTIIRASEEAILAVPASYKEASLGLGATRWGTVVRVILPSALPGIITSLIISLGRAAGETAPILFTAVIAMGEPVGLGGIFSQPTQALTANIYSIVAEHRAVEEIMHIPYGMAFTLISLVVLLNLIAIVVRARIQNKMRG